MTIKELKKDDFIGVWENKNIVPFSYDDKVEITFYLGTGSAANIRIQKSIKDDMTYFTEGFEIINFQDNSFEIIFKESDLNMGENLTLKCRMHLKDNPPAFVVDIPEFGERYMEKK